MGKNTKKKKKKRESEGKRGRERPKHQVSRSTPYRVRVPFNAASDPNRGECAQCCYWGWFCAPMRAPACLEPILESKNLITNR